jgi:hypothetical protein
MKCSICGKDTVVFGKEHVCSDCFFKYRTAECSKEQSPQSGIED